MCADATKLSGLLAADNVKLLEANGWTYDQFVFKMEDYHDISFSVNDHKNPVWRANFLAGKG